MTFAQRLFEKLSKSPSLKEKDNPKIKIFST